MAHKIIFEKEVTCPACGETVPMFFSNHRLFVVQERESDRHITGYQWLHGIQTDVVPHHYDIWQCTHCLYSDFRLQVENRKFSFREKKLINLYQGLSFKEKIPLKRLKRFIDMAQFDDSGALALHLSALYINLLPQNREDMDHAKLGRLYLRTGWLYRERNPRQPADSDQPSRDSATLKEMSECMEKLFGHALAIRDHLGNVRTFSETRSRELGFSLEADRNPYIPIIASLEDKMESVHTTLSVLQMSVLKDKDGLITPTISGESNGEDMDQKLVEMTELWPQIPLSESRCLEEAVKAFQYSFQEESGEQSTEQSMAYVSLILDLLVRMNRLEEALKWVTDIYKFGMNNKNQLLRRISEGKRTGDLSPHDEKMMNRKIGTINGTINRAGEMRRSILERLYRSKETVILESLEQTKDLPQAERAAGLLQAGVSEDLVEYVKSTGMLPEDEKKGWFKKK